MKRSFFIFIVCLFISVPAFAQESNIRQCGVPESYELEIYGDFEMCDIYQRQLGFKEEADKFRRRLEKRQALFVAPRNRAYRQYKADLDALHYGDRASAE